MHAVSVKVRPWHWQRCNSGNLMVCCTSLAWEHWSCQNTTTTMTRRRSCSQQRPCSALSTSVHTESTMWRAILSTVDGDQQGTSEFMSALCRHCMQQLPALIDLLVLCLQSGSRIRMILSIVHAGLRRQRQHDHWQQRFSFRNAAVIFKP